MNRRKKISIGAAASGLAMLIGAVAGLKSIAMPAAAAVPAGGAAVSGSNDATVTGSGNNVVHGAAGDVVNGDGNLVLRQSGTFNTFPPAEPKDAARGSAPDLARRLYGMWDESYSVPADNARADIRGSMSLLRNGSYTFQGFKALHGASDKGRVLDAEWAIVDTGTWVARDGYVTIVSAGVKSQPLSMSLDGKPLDMARAAALGLRVPRLEDFAPAGVGSDFRLLSLSANRMRVQADVPGGGALVFVATCTAPRAERVSARPCAPRVAAPSRA